VDGSADDQEPVDIVAMPRASGLSAENRRYVYDALVSSMIEGSTPNRESVSLLIDVTAGRIGTKNMWNESCGVGRENPCQLR
jgi:hypothetical protein